MLGVWSTDSFEYEGRHFTARGQIISPGPVQKHAFDAAAPDAHVEDIAGLAELGATWTSLGVGTSSFPALLDGLRAWGEVRTRMV